MLLQFAVKNFLSFKDEVVLNMAPAKGQAHSSHVFSYQAGKRVECLPIAALYGANASGKSNLIQAISFAQELIVIGTKSNDNIGVSPFLLDSDCRNKPSSFEFIFSLEKVLYNYGFSVTDRQVEEEWLFAYYSNREMKIFERKTVDGKVIVESGNAFFTSKKERLIIGFIAEGKRTNQLFLHEASERNVLKIIVIINWFKYNLQIIPPDSEYSPLVNRAYREKDFVRYLSLFMNEIDTNINEVKVEKTKDKDFFNELPDEIKEDLKNNKILNINDTTNLIEDVDSENAIITLLSEHVTKQGNKIPFDFGQESDGTKRMLHLFPILYKDEMNEMVFIIDEIDRSLHPLLSRYLLDIFIKSIEKDIKRQIIFSTHETNLLDLDLLRRDEIWFVEKDEFGSSHLTSLAEYKVRKDLRIANGYLNGRFGAIPFLGDPCKILDD